MARLMKAAAVASALLTALFAALYRSLRAGALLSLAITLGTIAYHMWMRLAVGGLFDLFMRGRADCGAWWFRPRRFEAALYRRLRVQKWKGRMPAYAPAQFDPGQRSWDEIARSMCQAELVHEVIAALSLLPVAASRRLGALPVFLVTSLLAAALDMLFAVMQRYNRPLVLRLAERTRRREAARAAGASR